MNKLKQISLKFYKNLKNNYKKITNYEDIKRKKKYNF